MSANSRSTPTSADAKAWALIFSAWMIASISTLGALFLGEVMGVPPCNLCWYQRIFMFPLALILPLGLFPLDIRVIRYALVLVVPGWLIALFHQLLVGGVIPEAIKPCAPGIPCTETTIRWFGFMTIPSLSLLAFSVLSSLLVIALLRSRT
jgi:disulfide bond formation protein DsbB